MVDFHSHVLPGVDDGAEDIDTGLAMLRESFRQGVDLLCATPHFYADVDNPAAFLKNREAAYRALRGAMQGEENLPKILLGAEVLYFPGISVADEIRDLCLQGTPFLLVEPPMLPWSDSMLDEVELCGRNLGCVPVLAHIDRYMRLLRDPTLFDRVRGRRLLIQANASFFLHRGSRDFALDCLSRGRIHFLGSDCHDLDARRPNLAYAAEIIAAAGLTPALERLDANVRKALGIGH